MRQIKVDGRLVLMKFRRITHYGMAEYFETWSEKDSNQIHAARHFLPAMLVPGLRFETNGHNYEVLL